MQSVILTKLLCVFLVKMPFIPFLMCAAAPFMKKKRIPPEKGDILWLFAIVPFGNQCILLKVSIKRSQLPLHLSSAPE